MLTDHSACTSLLNTPPTPCLAIHPPLQISKAQVNSTTTETTGEEERSNSAKDQQAETIIGKKIDGELQQSDPDLLQMIELLKGGTLPSDEKLARN